MTNIDYLSSENEFTIAIKFFTDDFETIITKKYDVELNLGKESEISNYEFYVTAYVLDNFSFIIDKVDKTVKKIEYVKKIQTDIAVWFYFKYKSNDKIDNIEIKNSFMTDYFHDQTNLLIFTFYEQEKAFKFDNKVLIQSFEI
jgi:hypothetical protein